MVDNCNNIRCFSQSDTVSVLSHSTPVQRKGRFFFFFLKQIVYNVLKPNKKCVWIIYFTTPRVIVTQYRAYWPVNKVFFLLQPYTTNVVHIIIYEKDRNFCRTKHHKSSRLWLFRCTRAPRIAYLFYPPFSYTLYERRRQSFAALVNVLYKHDRIIIIIITYGTRCKRTAATRYQSDHTNLVDVYNLRLRERIHTHVAAAAAAPARED